MIGIIAAMNEEKDAFLARMENGKEEKRAGFVFYRGSLAGKEVVLTKCGIGKANAAMITALMIVKYKPELVINQGCAGSLNEKAKVGDIVIGTQVADWDVDVPDESWKRGFGNPKLSFSCAEAACEAKTVSGGHEIHRGGIVSGESFIYKKSQVKKILKYYPEALCGEMEGSSVGRVCAAFGVPFLVIRSISDATLVRGDYKNFDFNLAQACSNAAELTGMLIRSF